MNYYIKGDAANAEGIKAAFNKLGNISNADKYNYENGNVLYFTAGGMVHMVDAFGSWANIIKTHPDYKELELPVVPKFKVGDWIVSIDDEGDMATEKIVSFTRHKVLLVDTNGCHTEYPKSELNGYHLWSVADAKDGDILMSDKGNPFIFCEDRIRAGYHNIIAYCGITTIGSFCESSRKECWTYGTSLKPATKEQRDMLFQKMKEAGYEWDADKKELKKIPKHFDISNFKPFDKVLVRCSNDEEWMIEFYCKYDTLVHTSSYRNYPFMGIGDSYSQCIPFEGNDHLLGTTEMPSEEFINW